MNNAVELYLDYLSNQKMYSTHTIDSYARELSVYEQFLKENEIKKYNDVTYPMIRRYLISLRKKQLAHSSVRHHLSVLRSFYKYLISINEADHNPFDLISQPKIEKRLPEFLYLDEFNELVESIDQTTSLGVRNAMILELLYATGIRCEEATTIQLNDIDYDRNEILIHGKGNKSRYVPFNDIAKAYLLEYIEISRVELMGDKKHNYLFVNRLGDPITTRGVADIIERVSKKSTLNKHVHPHMLRHTFATHMLENGASLRVVQEILGHNSLSSTQVYTHVTMDHLKNKINDSHPSSSRKISDDMFKKE